MVEFYNVKKKAKVEIAEASVTAYKYERELKKSGKMSTRYGLKAVDDDGTNLAKFCNKEEHDRVKSHGA